MKNEKLVQILEGLLILVVGILIAVFGIQTVVDTYFGILFLVGGKDGELPLSIFVGGKALENNKAGDLIREVAKVLGGGGGGLPNMANGRGRLLAKLPEAIEVLKGLIK